MSVNIGVANGERRTANAKSTNLHTSEQEMQNHLAVLLIFDHGIPSADMEKQVEELRKKPGQSWVSIIGRLS